MTQDQRTERITVRLFATELISVRRIAEETGLSESDVIRLAIKTLNKLRSKGKATI